MNNGELLTWIIFHANWKHCRTIEWMWLNGTRLSAGLNIKYHCRKETTKTNVTRTKLLSEICCGSWTPRSFFLEVFPEIQCPENMPEKPEVKDMQFFQTCRTSKTQHMNLNIFTLFTFIRHLGSAGWWQMYLQKSSLHLILIKYVVPFNTGKKKQHKEMSRLVFPHVILSVVFSESRVFSRKDVGRKRANGNCRRWDKHPLGYVVAAVTFSRHISAMYVATTHSWAAELVLGQVAITYAGWNTNPKKLKGKNVHRAHEEMAAVHWLSLLKPPPLVHNWHL